MKLLAQFISIITFGICLATRALNAADDPVGPLSEANVRQMLEAQGLTIEAINQVIEALKTNDKTKSLELDTVLFSHGGNMAFFVDNDSWNFSAAVKYKDRVSQIKDLFEVYYWNGGLKIEIVYKWMWIFVPRGTTLHQLDGATFGGKIAGRGLALSTSFVDKSPVMLEGGWTSRENGIGNVFILAAKVGAGGGGMIKVTTSSTSNANGRAGNQKNSTLKVGWPEIMFPKLEFKQKVVLPF